MAKYRIDLEAPPAPGKIFIDLCNGVEGPCLYLGDHRSMYRIAGPKPWGGGTTQRRFSISIEELKQAIAGYEGDRK